MCIFGGEFATVRCLSKLRSSSSFVVGRRLSSESTRRGDWANSRWGTSSKQAMAVARSAHRTSLVRRRTAWSWSSRSDLGRHQGARTPWSCFSIQLRHTRRSRGNHQGLWTCDASVDESGLRERDICERFVFFFQGASYRYKYMLRSGIYVCFFVHRLD